MFVESMTLDERIASFLRDLERWEAMRKSVPWWWPFWNYRWSRLIWYRLHGWSV